MSSNGPISGSCGCGAIRYTLHAPPKELTSCYCITCRKLHSAPFATFGRTQVSEVVWDSRETLVHRRYSSIGSRATCSRCGSQVYMEYFFQPHVISISAGL